MDFGLASKHQKEQEQRRKDMKRKLDQQKRDHKIQAAMEQDVREREFARIQAEDVERRRVEQEAFINGGVQYHAQLRPVPSDRTDDKLVLPPSVIEHLDRQGGLNGGVITFAVSVPGGSATHAGVAEFTAEEGTVHVPLRVALSLTKGAGLHSLAACGQVQIRFLRLPSRKKCLVRLQPRGQGFHLGGMKAVKMDLEHVLLESLRGHTALTEGDWLPIRNNGITYNLVVRELTPERQLLLIDTELSVDIMPSEQTEAEIQEEEAERLREEADARAADAREQARLQRAEAKAAMLDEEPPAGPEAVQILVRMPSGARLQRRFARGCNFQRVLDWVESEPTSLVAAGSFRLVQKWPGHAREIGPSEAGETLEKLGFARQEALFLQHVFEETPEAGHLEAAGSTIEVGEAEHSGESVSFIRLPERTAPVPQPLGHASVAGSAAEDSGAATAWAAAEERALQALDQRIDGVVTATDVLSAEPELEEIRGQDLADVFERLVALGMPPHEAAAAAKRFAPQLRELGDMGFENWTEAVQLLERYNGRLLRVANLLSESVGMPAANPTPSRTSTTALVASAPVGTISAPPVAKLGAGLPKQAVAAKFKELISAGMKPNDAAIKAIELVKAELVAAELVAAEPVALPAEPSKDPIEGQLRELAAMGFTAEQHNRDLIRKYAGRMERVIDALCSAC